MPADSDSDGDPDTVSGRFGGRKQFQELAHRTHSRMVEHPELFQFFPPTIELDPIVEKNALFLQGFFGGEQYKGPGIKTAHTFLHITDKQYDVFMDIAKEEVKKMCGPDTQTAKELLKGFEKLRNEIVDPRQRAAAAAKAEAAAAAAAAKKQAKRNKEQQKEAARAEDGQRPPDEDAAAALEESPSSNDKTNAEEQRVDHNANALSGKVHALESSILYSDVILDDASAGSPPRVRLHL